MLTDRSGYQCTWPQIKRAVLSRRDRFLRLRYLLWLISLGGIAACSTTGQKAQQAEPLETIRAELPTDSANNGDDAVFLTNLGVSNLPNGKCGMVLWTIDESRPIPVLRYVAGETGVVRFNQQPYELIRLTLDGQGAYGVFQEQSFAAGQDIRISVSIEFGQAFDGGTFLDRGIIRVERPDTATLVTPIAGLAGCRAK